MSAITEPPSRGAAVEVYSRSQGGWIVAKVEAVDGEEVTVSYTPPGADASKPFRKVVDWDDPEQARYPAQQPIMAWQPHENALNHPFRNAFSGRDLCREDSSADAQLSSGSKHKDDASWELTLDGQETTVVGVVDLMIEKGWDAVSQQSIKEAKMPAAMKIAELKDWDGAPLNLSKPGDRRENDMDPPDLREDEESWASDPPFFTIMSIDELRAWHERGRPVPEGSHNSGSEVMHESRQLKHPDDPLGLVADKLGRAIANERRNEEGKQLEPVFVHVYSLGHASVMKQLDKGLEFLGCGAFHAGCECHGVEWSYGFNDDGASGIFPSPPKYCEMHEYSESHYIGDTALTKDEFECWLQFLSREDYKQEDPLDPKFPKRAPGGSFDDRLGKFEGETPAQFFAQEGETERKKHDKYFNELAPVTDEAEIGHSYTFTDTSRMWTSYQGVEEDESGNEVKNEFPTTHKGKKGEKEVVRVGWWGDEYDLLSNNCCFLSDHLCKITCGKPLPTWIFSLAKVGGGMKHGAKFVADGTVAGGEKLLKGVGSVSRQLSRLDSTTCLRAVSVSGLTLRSHESCLCRGPRRHSKRRAVAWLRSAVRWAGEYAP